MVLGKGGGFAVRSLSVLNCSTPTDSSGSEPDGPDGSGEWTGHTQRPNLTDPETEPDGSGGTRRLNWRNLETEPEEPGDRTGPSQGPYAKNQLNPCWNKPSVGQNRHSIGPDHHGGGGQEQSSLCTPLVPKGHAQTNAIYRYRYLYTSQTGAASQPQ